MTSTGLDVFDSTVQQTNEWLSAIADELHTDNRRYAWLALRGTLHALRDNLGPDEAVKLSAQLPMLVRGVYFEGWRPSKTPVRDRDRDVFLNRVARAFERANPEGIYPAPAAQAVFKVLGKNISAGEIDDVQKALHEDIRAIWPTASQD